MRPLEELINLEDPGWVIVEEMMSAATNAVEVLPRDPERAKIELHRMQVTTRSLLGAVIYETGGLLIDNGWVRILGSGSDRMTRGIAEWNKGKSHREFEDPADMCLIADDAIGGFFAMNLGKFGRDYLNIYYYDPSLLEWESLQMGYSAFLNFIFNVELNEFYSSLRWEGWQQAIAELGCDQGILIFPPLWTEEGKDIQNSSKARVPIAELYNANIGATRFIQPENTAA